MYLALKTDNSLSEIILLNNKDTIDKYSWDAGRSLALDLPTEVSKILQKNSVEQINGYIGYLGPGSFTGLRIGLSSLNALAYANSTPIVGAIGDDWLRIGVEKLSSGKNDKILVPEYGSEAHITQPKK